MLARLYAAAISASGVILSTGVGQVLVLIRVWFTKVYKLAQAISMSRDYYAAYICMYANLSLLLRHVTKFLVALTARQARPAMRGERAWKTTVQYES